MTEAEAQQAVADLPLAWEKTISVTDAEGAVKNIVNYRQYNRARPLSQETSC